VPLTDALIRALGESDLDAMTALERLAWADDVQASPAQFGDRLMTFARGFLGASIDGRLVGMASSQIVHYERDQPLRSWRELTADGWISRTHEPSANCLHFVSICVHPDFRNRGIAAALTRARLELARSLNLRFALSDTRLPGLASYLAIHDGEESSDYVNAVLTRKVPEPVVRMYLRLGFEPLGLLADCMTSDRESANYGLAMLKTLNKNSTE
jgi:GNAT superfamily N-acetyltransferase